MSSMERLSSIAIGVLLLIAVVAIIPMVGDRIEDARGTLAADSQWNSSVNTDIVEGYDIWGDVGSMISLAAVVIVVGVVIAVLVKFKTVQ